MNDTDSIHSTRQIDCPVHVSLQVQKFDDSWIIFVWLSGVLALSQLRLASYELLFLENWNPHDIY